MNTSQFLPKAPNYEERVRDSFSRQRVMSTLGASLDSVRPGSIEVSLPFREDLVQQHGYLHAAVVTAIVDTACGYAALSLMPGDCEVLTVEYKVNLLAKAVGRRFIAHGWVVKPGKTISVCSGEVRADSGDGVKLVASMMATMFTVRGSAT